MPVNKINFLQQGKTKRSKKQILMEWRTEVYNRIITLQKQKNKPTLDLKNKNWGNAKFKEIFCSVSHACYHNKIITFIICSNSRSNSGFTMALCTDYVMRSTSPHHSFSCEVKSRNISFRTGFVQGRVWWHRGWHRGLPQPPSRGFFSEQQLTQGSLLPEFSLQPQKKLKLTF